MTNIVEEKFTGPVVWHAETVFRNGGLSILDDTCHSEIEAVAQVLRDNPLPIEALRPDDFELPACKALMAEVRETVDNGVGFTVIDRLDVDVLGLEICTRISGIVSFESVYNILLEEHRDVLPSLYLPFYFDRLGEHTPSDERVSYKPVFEIDGDALSVNYSPDLVELGYLTGGEKMHEKARQAFDALCKTTQTDRLCKRFVFQRGQIQVVNHRRLAHRRTAFHDRDEPGKKRHLVRLWLRKSGRPFYQG